MMWLPCILLGCRGPAPEAEGQPCDIEASDDCGPDLECAVRDTDAACSIACEADRDCPGGTCGTVSYIVHRWWCDDDGYCSTVGGSCR